MAEVTLIRDRDTGRLRGFGFVQMEEDDVDSVISALDGKDFGGRTLKVNLAKEREDRREGSFRPQRRPEW